MKLLSKNDVRFVTFDHIHRVQHGVFTRHGGVSRAPYDTLNVGRTVGDSPTNITQNLQRMAAAIGAGDRPIVWPEQVHGASVQHVTRRTSPDHTADALITADPEVVLMLRFADCVPILLYDPVQHALGVAHAGWRGTVQDVAGETVRAMQATFGSRPVDLQAGIGPSICGSCYEVGPEVVTAARQAFGPPVDEAITPKTEANPTLDLWHINALALRRAGVNDIVVTDICTYEQTRDFYSYRREGRQTGRFAMLACLERPAAS